MIQPLSLNEIEDIINAVLASVNNKCGTRDNSNKELRKYMQNQLSCVKINSLKYDAFKKDIVNEYIKSQATPGECVGLIASQSITEDMSQKTLNTFHSAGISVLTVIAGVPRFTELLDVTKNPNMMNAYVHLNFTANSIQEIREQINNRLVNILMKHIIINISYESCSYYDWYVVADKIMNFPQRQTNNCFIINLDIEKMFKYKVQCRTIVEKLNKNDLIAYHSPVGEYIHIFTDDYNEYNEEEFIDIVEKTYIQGIKGIDDICFRTVFENNTRKWIIETIGSNLKEILSLPFVDFNKTYSNNLWEIYNVLGIEATYNFLVDEMNAISTGDGGYINICHINLLVSLMTFEGLPTPISRYGVNINHYDPCSMAAFEESFDKLIQAGAFNIKEDTKSISSSIMVGKIAPVGTGFMDLIMDIPSEIPKVTEDEDEDNEIIFF